MLIEIFWSDSAKKSYYEVIDYLEQNWSQQEITQFILRTEAVLKLISHNPTIYPAIKLNIHRCVLSKHNSLFYTIEDNTIIILSCWDNRKVPKEFKL